jgi:hypothetical protein
MNVKTFLLTGVAMLTASPLAAHHNFAAHYRGDEIIERAGVVTDFRFVNPHARVYIEVTNPDGTTEEWMAEGDASVALRRSGWTPDQLKPGDRVRIVGNPSHNGTHTMSWDSITLDNGTAFGGGDGRLEERVRILERHLAEYRSQRTR